MDLAMIKDLPESWLGFASLVVLVLGGVVVTWLRTEKIATKTDNATIAAALAASNTASVSNGAIPGLTTSIAEVLSQMAADRRTNLDRHEANIHQFAVLGTQLADARADIAELQHQPALNPRRRPGKEQP